MLDKNKNGEIDKTEQEEAMKNIHSMTLPKARWAWSAMDTDGDGKISESEFLKGMQAISDKVGEEQLLDSIVRAWTDHPLALERERPPFAFLGEGSPMRAVIVACLIGADLS